MASDALAPAPAARLPRLEAGTEIDGYRILERLHSGGAGHVYRVVPSTAADPGFPLVMKVPAVGPGEPVVGLVGFETELMIHPALKGPHVPRLVATGDLHTTPYLVMEQVAGESLETIVAGAPLAGDRVAALGAAIADALQTLHEQEAVHQDLKPANVIVGPDGRAVLIDFGFAFHARFPDLLAEARHHAAGSAPYVSPEQLRDRRGDPRSDLFSLGVILYELATGELPFGVPQTQAGTRDRLWRLPVPPRAHVASLGPALQEVILRCLENDAQRRYQSAAHVAFDLREPSQVVLTRRSYENRLPGFSRQIRAWWRGRTAVGLTPPGADAPRLAPVILIAVDTEHIEDTRHPRIQRIAQQVLSVAVEHRVMCVSVIASGAVGEGTALTDSQSGRHLEHLARLRRWVEPLGLPPDRLSLHVMQAFDPASAIVELARRSHADLIVLGAPGPSERLLGWWRSVASSVTAAAHCSVYVVRVK